VRGVEQLPQRVLAVGVAGLQLALDVLDHARQQEQPVSCLFELLAGDDELVLGEAEFFRSASRLVVALLTRRFAVHAWATGAVPHGERSPAPKARALGHGANSKINSAGWRGCYGSSKWSTSQT